MVKSQLTQIEHTQTSEVCQIAIVHTKVNSQLVGRLVQRAQRAILARGASVHSTLEVPGGFELPLGCAQMIENPKVDAVVAIACIHLGDTAHGMLIAQETTAALLQLQLQSKEKTGRWVPIGNSILSANSLDEMNLREAYAETAVEAVITLLESFRTIEIG